MTFLLILDLNGWLLFALIAAVIIIIVKLYVDLYNFKLETNRNNLSQTNLRKNEDEATKLKIENLIKEYDGLLKQKEILIESGKNEIIGIQNEMALKANEKGQELALLQFQKWKKEELDKYIKIVEDAGVEKATALLRQWKIDNEDRIRKDAANRSVRNVLGKVTEHLIPFSEALKNFNPKDIRFIGSPIDLIIFDGAEELNKDEMTIYFVEVKTGTSSLSKRQQIIKDAIQNRRIRWMRVNMKSFGDDVNEALAQ